MAAPKATGRPRPYDHCGRTSQIPGISEELPGPVRTLAATPGDTTVDLSWLAPANAVAAGVLGYHIITLPADADPITQAGTSVTVTGLTNDVEYTFIVRAIGPGGAGPAESVTATPTGPAGFWTLHSMPGGPDTIWHDVVYAAGIGFVAVGEDDDSLGCAAVSTNAGASWTSATIPAGTGPIYAVAFDGTTLTAVGRDDTFSIAKSLTSTNGLAWTLHGMDGGTIANDVAFGAGVFAAAADNTGFIQTAADGAAWTARSGAGSGQRTNIVRVSALSLFVARGAGGSPGAINTSSNGTSGWTNQVTPGTVYTVLVTDGTSLLTFNNDGSFTVLSSADATAWTTQQSVGATPQSAIRDTANSQWIVVTSSTTVTAPNLSSSWTTVETSNRAFQAMATDGTNVVAVGGYDDDGNPVAGVH